MNNVNKDETEYEKRAKKKFLDRQMDLTIMSYRDNEKDELRDKILDRFC